MSGIEHHHVHELVLYCTAVTATGGVAPNHHAAITPQGSESPRRAIELFDVDQLRPDVDGKGSPFGPIRMPWNLWNLKRGSMTSSSTKSDPLDSMWGRSKARLLLHPACLPKRRRCHPSAVPQMHGRLQRQPSLQPMELADVAGKLPNI